MTPDEAVQQVGQGWHMKAMKYPVRPQPIPSAERANQFERGCATCNTSFLALAVGKTGERGFWTDCFKWYCSTKCRQGD